MTLRMPDSILPGESLPPVLSPVTAGALVDPPNSPPSRSRTAIALFTLGFYVLLPAVLGASQTAADGALLPTSLVDVLRLCAIELGLFAVVFGLAAWLGRWGRDELFLRWRGGWWVLPRAAGWSVVLRLGVGAVLLAGALAWQTATGTPLENLDELRPKVEAMVDPDALRDPLYQAVMLTLVSFVLAGLREELWRAGMVAALGGLFPRAFGGRRGNWLALVPVALLFGLGHTPQGLAGVAATTFLGLGLGAIMLLHRSVWDAVLAHGLFNATTFILLPLLAEHLPRVDA